MSTVPQIVGGSIQVPIQAACITNNLSAPGQITQFQVVENDLQPLAPVSVQGQNYDPDSDTGSLNGALWISVKDPSLLATVTGLLFYSVIGTENVVLGVTPINLQQEAKQFPQGLMISFSMTCTG